MKITFYGEVPGTAGTISKLDDGALLTLVTPESTAVVALSAGNLLELNRALARIAGHVTVDPSEWREKLRARLGELLRRHESRCLDDDADREVVVEALVAALNPRMESRG